MREKVTEYLETTDVKTIPGLALYLGFTSEEPILDAIADSNDRNHKVFSHAYLEIKDDTVAKSLGGIYGTGAAKLILSSTFGLKEDNDVNLNVTKFTRVTDGMADDDED